MNNANDFVIGVDLGTSACKCIALGLSGKIIGQHATGYGDLTAQSQWKEQDPEVLFKGLLHCVKAMLDNMGVKEGKCLGLSVGGALHSILAVDSAFHPLTNVLTWADNRASSQSERIRNEYNETEIYQRTGCPVNPMYPFEKILWIKENEREVFDNTFKFITAKEYAIWKLTGRTIVDYAIASGSGIFNINTMCWDSEVLEIIGIDRKKFSPVVSPTHFVANISSEIKKYLNLRYDIPLYLGSADAVNSSIGAGTINSDSLTCMIGTSGAIRTITPDPVFDSRSRLWCYCIDSEKYLVGGAINNGGLALAWLRDLFTIDRKDEHSPDFENILQWASDSPALANGLFCLPFLTSERCPNWNPYMKAVFWGLSLHHDHRHIAQSVLEGIGFRLRSVMDVIDESVGVINVLRASGGFIQSRHWVQTLSNILNREIQIPENGETSALGSAYWVMLARKMIDNFYGVIGINRIEQVIKPQQELIHAYQFAFSIYKDIYNSNKNLFNQVHGL